MWIRTLRPLADFGYWSINPPGPEIGKWPICRAVFLLRPVWSNSSSLQNVPSISTRSLDSAHLFHSVLRPGSVGATKTRFPANSKAKAMTASWAGSVARSFLPM